PPREVEVTAASVGLLGLTLLDVQKPTAESGPRDKVIFRNFDGLELEFTGRRAEERRYVTIEARSTAEASAKQAAELAARLGGREFEIPAFKYESLFQEAIARNSGSP